MESTNLTGVSKFVQRYSNLKRSHCPTAAITHALHMFAKTDSKFDCIQTIYLVLYERVPTMYHDPAIMFAV